jgi:hypothetical protein
VPRLPMRPQMETRRRAFFFPALSSLHIRHLLFLSVAPRPCRTSSVRCMVRRVRLFDTLLQRHRRRPCELARCTYTMALSRPAFG